MSHGTVGVQNCVNAMSDMQEKCVCGHFLLVVMRRLVRVQTFGKDYRGAVAAAGTEDKH